MKRPTTFFTMLALGCMLQTAQATVKQSHRFDDILACHAQENAPGIAVLASQGGKLLYRNARGLANAELNVPLTEETVFHIGSVTKQFTAAAILILQEQNKLSLDDDLHRYLPDWPTEGHRVTIKQLLSHTSGLADYTANQEIFKTRLQEFMSLDDMLALFAQDPMVAAPGEAYHYSNTGYVVLGKVIEVASGQPYGEFLQQQIFDKLAMKHTQLAGRQLIPGRANGYTHSATSMMNDNRTEQYRNAMLIDMQWTHAAGAIASTIDDMLTWFTALKDGKVISADSYQQMSTPARLNDGTLTRYGYGLDIGPIYNSNTISHQGSVPGFFSWSVYFPQEDLYVVALSNNDSLHSGPVAAHIAGEHLGLIPSFNPVKLDASELNRFTGRYQLGNDSFREITLHQGQLYSQRDGGSKTPVFALANDTLGFPCAPDYFKFNRDPQGREQMLSYSIFSTQPKSALKIN